MNNTTSKEKHLEIRGKMSRTSLISLCLLFAACSSSPATLPDEPATDTPVVKVRDDDMSPGGPLIQGGDIVASPEVYTVYFNGTEGQLIDRIAFHGAGDGDWSELSKVIVVCGGIKKCQKDDATKQLVCDLSDNRGLYSPLGIFFEAAPTAKIGATYSLTLESANDILLKDPTAKVDGTFPIKGNTFTISSKP